MEFKAPSGAKVTIGAASWGDVTTLRRAMTQHLSEGLTKDTNVMQLALKVESSEDVYNAVFACLSRCTYNDQKITPATFEPENAREDYMDIVCACIDKNLEPFKKKHPSQLLTFLGVLNQPAENPA